tara:strand:+ start:41 stop:184 length:144 start_codon:yes stop_codon:yes gene_type:complete
MKETAEKMVEKLPKDKLISEVYHLLMTLSKKDQKEQMDWIINFKKNK